MLVIPDRAVVQAQTILGSAAAKESLAAGCIELDCAVEVLHGACAVAFGHIGGAAIGESNRVGGIKLDRPIEVLDRLVRLADVNRGEAAVRQGFGTTGIDQ